MWSTFFLTLVSVAGGHVFSIPGSHSGQQVIQAAHPNASHAGLHVKRLRNTKSIEQMASTKKPSALDVDTSISTAENPLKWFSAKTLYKPEGKASGSVIFVDPWGAEEAWMKYFFHDAFENLAKKGSRVIEALPRQFRYPNGEKHWIDRQREYSAWYRYKDWHAETVIERDVTDAVGYIHKLIEQEYKIVPDYRRIVVAGYSQGANLALEAGFRFSHPLGLVFSHRGVVLESRLHNTQRLAATPYILTAGTKDDEYSVDWVRKGCRFVLGKQVPAFLKSFKGLGHADRSDEENKLAVDSMMLALSKKPLLIRQVAVAKSTSWTHC